MLGPAVEIGIGVLCRVDKTDAGCIDGVPESPRVVVPVIEVEFALSHILEGYRVWDWVGINVAVHRC